MDITICFLIKYIILDPEFRYHYLIPFLINTNNYYL